MMTIKDFQAFVQEVADRYPVEVFPEPKDGSWQDLWTAQGCRLACYQILAELGAMTEPETADPEPETEQDRIDAAGDDLFHSMREDGEL